MKIAYPQSFVSAVGAEFEGRQDILALLEAGDCSLGRVLAKEAERMNPEEVARLLRAGRQDQVLDSAERLTRRTDLYRAWIRIAADSISDDQDAPESVVREVSGM